MEICEKLGWMRIANMKDDRKQFLIILVNHESQLYATEEMSFADLTLEIRL